MIKILFLLSLGLFTQLLQATGVHTVFPDIVKPHSSYVFYSHGAIVEGDNPRPVHPKFGTYEFPEIREALMNSDHELIAYHRPAGVSVQEHINRLVTDVRRLLDAGVKEQNITLIGFSKGGAISIRAASLMKKNLNLVILASCFNNLTKNPDTLLYGNILSIYETSDFVGSCQTIIDRSAGVKQFKEIALSTGKGHGTFYTPDPVWLTHVKSWLK